MKEPFPATKSSAEQGISLRRGHRERGGSRWTFGISQLHFGA